jgi:hypothetical protein
MLETNTRWVEIESKSTDYRVRTFRGLVAWEDIESLTSGRGIEFLRLVDCYWYNDADDEAETGKTLGTFEQLGQGTYSNFTGEIFIRCSTIINFSLLKTGFKGESVTS